MTLSDCQIACDNAEGCIGFNRLDSGLCLLYTGPNTISRVKSTPTPTMCYRKGAPLTSTTTTVTISTTSTITSTTRTTTTTSTTSTTVTTTTTTRWDVLSVGKRCFRSCDACGCCITGSNFSECVQAAFKHGASYFSFSSSKQICAWHEWPTGCDKLADDPEYNVYHPLRTTTTTSTITTTSTTTPFPACPPGSAGPSAKLGCHCNSGYAGVILRSQSPPFYSGRCFAVPCPDSSRGKNLPSGCECNAGYVGTISITTSKPYYSGSCEGAPCPANATGDVPSGCTCDAGYYGTISTSTSAPYYSGTCLGASCPPQSAGHDVPSGCVCNSGFFGTIEATSTPPYYSGDCISLGSYHEIVSERSFTAVGTNSRYSCENGTAKCIQDVDLQSCVAFAVKTGWKTFHHAPGADKVSGTCAVIQKYDRSFAVRGRADWHLYMLD